jgi:hypothetical protein
MIDPGLLTRAKGEGPARRPNLLSDILTAFNNAGQLWLKRSEGIFAQPA